MSRCGVAVVELDPLAWEEAATPPTEANPFGAPFESPIRTPGRGSAKAVGGSLGQELVSPGKRVGPLPPPVMD